MTNAHTLHTIRYAFGIIGNFTSFFLFASPIPTFVRIWKNKSVEEFHPYPYLAGVLNCVFWVFYGLPFNHPDSWLVVSINSIGLVLELSYIAVYTIYADSKKKRLNVLYLLIGEALVFTCIATGDLKGFHTHKRRIMFVGIICDIFSIILYASPLSIMWKVIKTKSSEYMPFWICLAGFSNGIIWAIYAVIGQLDYYILIGNGVGTVLGACQLTLKWYYREGTPQTGDMEKAGKPAKEVQLQARTSV